MRPEEVREADFLVDDGSLLSRVMAAAPAGLIEELDAAVGHGDGYGEDDDGGEKHVCWTSH